MITATANWTAAHAKRPRRPVFLLEIAGYGKVFGTVSGAGPAGVVGTYKAWVQAISGGDQSIDFMNGSSSLNNLLVTVIDRANALTADFAGVVFEGLRAALKMGYVGLAEADFITMYTGVVETVEADLAATAYTFTLKDTNRLNQQVIYTAGDDGRPTGSGHLKTVLGNPMDIFVSILETYVGFATHEVNEAHIYAYRDALWAGMNFSFSIDSPPEAKNFIEQELMKPLGGVMYTDELGRITCDFCQPQPGAITPAYTFTPDDMSELPMWQQNALVNTINYRLDENGNTGGSGFGVEVVASDSDSVDRFGEQGQAVVESKGVRSAFQGVALAKMVCRSMFARYSNKNPKLTLNTDWRSVLVNVGDFVAVTHPRIPNRETGGIGVTNRLFQVVGKAPDFAAGRISFDVTDASRVQAFGVARIAPNGTPAYTLASAFQKARYLFITDGSGKQSDGSQGATFA